MHQNNPKSVIIERMSEEHLDKVVQIESDSFSIPWSKKSFEESLALDYTIFLVVMLEDTKEIVGYIGIYKVFNEGDITNIAIDKKYRGMGIGTNLMLEAMNYIRKLEIKDLMLEVRKSNLVAQGLYEKVGFKSIGIRRNFYEKPLEDAVIMWKQDI